MSLNLDESTIAELVDEKKQDIIDSVNIGEITGYMYQDIIFDRIEYGFQNNDVEILDFIYKNALKLGTNIDEITDKYRIYFDATGLYDLEKKYFDVVEWATSKGIFPGDGKKYDIYGLLKANRPDIIKMLQPYLVTNDTAHDEIVHYFHEYGDSDIVKQFRESLSDVGIVPEPASYKCLYE